MVYYLSQSDDLCIYFVNDNGDYSPSSWTRKFHVPEACCDVSVCFNSLYFKTLFSEVAAGYKAIVCVIDIVVCVCVAWQTLQMATKCPHKHGNIRIPCQTAYTLYKVMFFFFFFIILFVYVKMQVFCDG